jgi:hypothetical protein
MRFEYSDCALTENSEAAVQGEDMRSLRREDLPPRLRLGGEEPHWRCPCAQCLAYKSSSFAQRLIELKHRGSHGDFEKSEVDY